MRALTCLLVLTAAATAAPDALRIHKLEVRRLEGEEKRFWKEFQGRYIEARKANVAEIRLAYAKSKEHPEATYDPAGFERLFADYAVIQTTLGEADAALADSGHAKALDTLWKALLRLAKDADELDAEVYAARPMRRYDFDLRPSVGRHGLEARRTALVSALAKCPGIVAFLAGDGWKKAVRADRRKSLTRRVAALDVLAAAGGDDARDALAQHVSESEAPLRIAALEGLLRHGAKGRPAIAPLLRDGKPVVRRALLQEIRALNGDAGWIGPVLAGLDGARGQERAEILLTLGALTNQTLGDDPVAWKEWFDDYKNEIEGGDFDKTRIEVQERKRAPSKGLWTFCDIPTLSRAVAFVLDGGNMLATPASWKIQRGRFFIEWTGMRTQWEKKYPSHYTMIQRRFDAALKVLPDDARFGVVGMYGDAGAWPLGEKKLLQHGKRDFAAARKFVQRLPMSGWCGPYLGLIRARDLDGVKGSVDTIFLLSPAKLRGGRYPAPTPLLAAAKRVQRFRRIVVHTLRINNEGDASVAVMKGLAEMSGGTYVWLEEPPK